MPPRFLAIDDYPDSLVLMKSLLRVEFPDCEILTASGGAQGIEAARDHRPDVILLDARMPGMDGFETCRRLKADTLTAPIPVLMVSGILTQPQHRITGYDSGAEGYLCKPFEPEELNALVRTLLRVKKFEERLRTEEELARERELLDALMVHIPDAIYFKDRASRFLRVNAAHARLSGLKDPEEAVGKTDFDYFDHALAEEATADEARIMETGVPMTDKVESVRDRQGLERWFSATKAPIRHWDGSVSGIVGISRDITERRLEEEALHKLAQDASSTTGLTFFHNLVAGLTRSLGVKFAFIGERIVGDSGKIQTVAVGAEGDVGDNFIYDLKDTPCERVLHEGVCSYPEGVSELFPNDPLLREMGVESYFGVPLLNSADKGIGLLVVMDTKPMRSQSMVRSMLQLSASRASAELERMRAVEDLWESEERYRTLTDDVLDASVVGVLILNASREAVWGNQALEKFLALPRDRLLGMKADKVADALREVLAAPEEVVGRIMNPLDTETDSEPIECEVARGGGRWLQHWSQPIRSGLYAGGRVEYFNDITDRHELEAQLLQAQKMEGIGQLAGGIAHDFNNLLTAILGFGRLISDQIGEEHPIYSEVQEIIHAGDRAAKLTRQLLAFSRKQILQVHPLDLNDVVRDMDQLLRRTLGADIELVTLLGHKPGTMEADTGQLEQVIINLAVNARDAMPRGGKLTIQTSRVTLDEEYCHNRFGFEPGDYLQLSVRDTGQGMDKDVQSHAFEPFYTTKEKGKGTGLGLSTVYGIVKQFGGALEIESQPNHGTEVKLYFPRSTHEAPSTSPHPQGALPRGSETILLAEDEDTVRRLTVRILTSQGYKVLQARHGGEALALWEDRKEEIDLVLTDVVMPQMGGEDLAERLRASDPDVRIIFTSGFTELSPAQRGGLKQDTNLVLKPYTREALARKIREVLDD